MTDTVLEVNNISKKFCRDLKRSMIYGCVDILRDSLGISTKPDILRNKEFWSANDISFKLARGECLGIIGPNGAGKSTLLKMLNGIIKPDKGTISYKGRMGALIEVGAGFHPILTGRENIYINGTILGLSKAEIDKQFDAIVEFSGLEEFLDTPVKNYSSGMRVRLGFSIAAHLSPDILLIDEVLAVGDLSFQAKCRNRIVELVNNHTAIIFISHSMHLVQQLCQNSICMSKGKTIYSGNTSDTIDIYRNLLSQKNTESLNGIGKLLIHKCETYGNSQIKENSFEQGEPFTIRIHYKLETTNEIIYNPIFNVFITTSEGVKVCGIRTDLDKFVIDKIVNSGYIDLRINKPNLLPNTYNINIAIFTADSFSFYDCKQDIFLFTIRGGKKINGIVNLPHHWDWNKNENI